MKPIHLLPLLLFLTIGVALLVGLTLRPSEIPSAVVGKPVPEFSLPPLDPTAEGLSSESLKDGNTKLVNVFASWCGPCRIEHPFLMELQAQGVIIHGLNYKDEEDDARRFLIELESPYTLIGKDRDGRVGIDWGVSGVPETFVVDGRGMVLHQHIGPLSREAIENKIAPLLGKSEK